MRLFEKARPGPGKKGPVGYPIGPAARLTR